MNKSPELLAREIQLRNDHVESKQHSSPLERKIRRVLFATALGMAAVGLTINAVKEHQQNIRDKSFQEGAESVYQQMESREIDGKILEVGSPLEGNWDCTISMNKKKTLQLCFQPVDEVGLELDPDTLQLNVWTVGRNQNGEAVSAETALKQLGADCALMERDTKWRANTLFDRLPRPGSIVLLDALAQEPRKEIGC